MVKDIFQKTFWYLQWFCNFSDREVWDRFLWCDWRYAKSSSNSSMAFEYPLSARTICISWTSVANWFISDKSTLRRLCDKNYDTIFFRQKSKWVINDSLILHSLLKMTIKNLKKCFWADKVPHWTDSHLWWYVSCFCGVCEQSRLWPELINSIRLNRHFLSFSIIFILKLKLTRPIEAANL